MSRTIKANNGNKQLLESCHVYTLIKYCVYMCGARAVLLFPPHLRLLLHTWIEAKQHRKHAVGSLGSWLAFMCQLLNVRRNSVDVNHIQAHITIVAMDISPSARCRLKTTKSPHCSVACRYHKVLSKHFKMPPPPYSEDSV